MKLKLKILTAIFLAFVTTSIASNTVFIAGTPYINEPFIAEIRSSPGVFYKRTTDYVASFSTGRKGVEEYQQKRVDEYVTQNTTYDAPVSGGSGGGGTPANPLTPTVAPVARSPLPPPVRPEEFVAQGYTESSRDVYTKNDVSAKTLYIHIGADAKFEKKTINIDGQQVDAWVPL